MAVSWLGVFGSLVLASIGVYIGRFVRLNSWDVLLHPRHVVEVVHARLVAEPPEMAPPRDPIREWRDRFAGDHAPLSAVLAALA